MYVFKTQLQLSRWTQRAETHTPPWSLFPEQSKPTTTSDKYQNFPFLAISPLPQHFPLIRQCSDLGTFGLRQPSSVAGTARCPGVAAALLWAGGDRGHSGPEPRPLPAPHIQRCSDSLPLMLSPAYSASASSCCVFVGARATEEILSILFKVHECVKIF